MYGTNKDMLGNQTREKLVFTEFLNEVFVEKMELKYIRKYGLVELKLASNTDDRVQTGTPTQNPLQSFGQPGI